MGWSLGRLADGFRSTDLQSSTSLRHVRRNIAVLEEAQDPVDASDSLALFCDERCVAGNDIRLSKG